MHRQLEMEEIVIYRIVGLKQQLHSQNFHKYNLLQKENDHPNIPVLTQRSRKALYTLLTGFNYGLRSQISSCIIYLRNKISAQHQTYRLSFLYWTIEY